MQVSNTSSIFDTEPNNINMINDKKNLIYFVASEIQVRIIAVITRLKR